MRTPSLKSLVPLFGEDNARKAKKILLANPSDQFFRGLRESSGLHSSAKNWQVRMDALNRLGEFHGVETLALSDGSFVDYLNAGDTYASTVYRWRGNYYVGNWGDLVERHGSMDLQEAIAANGYQQH